MIRPTCIIFVERVTGEIDRAFTWTRDPEEGIEEAKYSAECLEIPVARVWAEPVTLPEDA